MSPEQCEGLREVDARSDLYSLGCVMFHLLAGKPPFDNGGQAGVITAHLTAQPPLIRSACPMASPALETIVQCLLAKPREQRFASARAVLAALSDPNVDALVGGDGGVAPTADIPRGPATAPATGAGFSSIPMSAPMPMLAPIPGPTMPAANLPASPGPATIDPRRPPTATAARAPASVATPPPRRRLGVVITILACVATAVIVVLVMKCGGSSNNGTTVATTIAMDAPPSAVAAPDAPATIAGTPADAAFSSLLPADAASRGITGRNTKPDARTTTATIDKNQSPPDAAPSVVRVEPPDAAPVVVRIEPPDAAPPRGEIVVKIAFNHQSFSYTGNGADLDRVAEAMKADPRLRATITGLADNTEGGATPDQLALSRANALKMHLVNRKVDRDRFELHGFVVEADGNAQRAIIRVR
jgi:outer membrane protein OmpA-like peptidoglycan-associated protein